MRQRATHRRRRYAEAIAAADNPAEGEDPAPFPVAALVAAANHIFDAATDSAILLSPFDQLNAEVLAALTEGGCPPTVVVNLATRGEDVVGARMEKEFRWSPPEPEQRPDDADDDWEPAPAPTDEELAEMKEGAVAAKTEELQADYAADTERLAAVLEACTSAGVLVLPTVDGTGNPERVYLRLERALRPYVAQHVAVTVAGGGACGGASGCASGCVALQCLALRLHMLGGTLA